MARVAAKTLCGPSILSLEYQQREGFPLHALFIQIKQLQNPIFPFFDALNLQP